MNELGFLVGGIALGCVGSTHCVAMCGGLAGALSLGLPRIRQTTANLLWVHLCSSGGRLISYAIAGAVSGGVGSLVTAVSGAQGMVLLRGLAGVLVLLVGLYVAGWSTALARLESLGGRLWRAVNSRVGRRRPSSPFAAALLFGLIWGWLPCGLVYTTLALAATTGQAAHGLVLMVGFGAGTIPMMLATGVVTPRMPSLLRQTASRRLAGLLMIAFGIWTIAAPSLIARLHGTASQPCAAHGESPGR